MLYTLKPTDTGKGRDACYNLLVQRITVVSFKISLLQKLLMARSRTNCMPTNLSKQREVDTLCLEDLHAFIAQALCLEGKTTMELADLQVLTVTPLRMAHLTKG
ncbi:hypothetical protein E2I00_012559, partial [Balaenoptera physalus]